MKTRFYFALIILFSFVWVNSSLADPRMWGPSGVPVRHGMYLSWDRSVAQNSMGYSLAVWSDARTGGRDIYAQLIAPNGETLWEPQGIAVVSEPHVQLNPAVCAVNDGWIVAWFDQRDMADSNRSGIWAQKLDLNGNPVWLGVDLNGVYLGNSCRVSYTPRIDLFDDNLGGASAVWIDKAAISDPTYYPCFQHVSATGDVELALPLIASSPSFNFAVSTGDGLGNVIISWPERDEGNFDRMRSQKISSAGLKLWDPLGVVVDSTPSNYIVYTLDASSDGAGGCYLAWQTTLGEDAWAGSRVTRLSAEGIVLWDPGENGGSANEFVRRIVPSVSNGQTDGCFLVGVNAESWNSVRVRKLHSDGTRVWNANGVVFNSPDINSWSMTALSDQSGGLVVTYSNNISEGIDAIRFDAAGALPWGANPQAALVGTGQNSSITFGGGNCYVFALNDENETPSHLAYQQINVETGTPLLPMNGQSLVGGLVGSCGEYRTIGMAGHRTAVVWNDYRYSNNVTPIFYQILDSLGNPERTLNGERLAPDSTKPSQVSIQLCTDGNGGFFCGFMDRQNETNVLRLTRVNAIGERIGREEGEPVDPNGFEPFSFCIASDGVGGCYVCWNASLQVIERRVLLMRMNSDCQPMWGSPLVLSPEDIPAGSDMTVLTATSDGGCIAMWGDPENPPISAAKVLDDAIVWNTTFCATCGEYYGFRESVIPDTAGGVYVAVVAVFGMDFTIVVQHLDSQGNSRWNLGGIHLVDLEIGGWLNCLIPSNNGNFYVVWRERGGQLTRLVAQRISAGGNSLWLQPGITLMRVQGHGEFIATEAGDGNLFFTYAEVWENTRTIRGKYINTDGDPVDEWWVEPEGGLVSDTLLITSPSMTCLDNRNVSMVWQYGSSADGTYGNLFAQMINTGDPLATASRQESTVPLSYHLSQNFPNPFNPVTQIRFALPKAGKVSLKVYNTLGQEVMALINGKMDAGEHSVVFDGSTLSSGVYMYWLQADDFNQCRKMVVLK